MTILIRYIPMMRSI